jgi:phosphoribosylformylglycinamidine synthase
VGKDYTVLVTIENKKFINDPEGKTILQDLILKSRYLQIKSVRTAKVLKLTVDAETANEATEIVKKMCDDLRIFNPIVSDCKVSISDKYK